MTSELRRPKVSVLLPTYNRAVFLPDALQAIRAQTYEDWELVVVDDGSRDDTATLIPQLTAAWPQHVQYRRQDNQGAYGARNTAIGLARGEYLSFYDSDDVWRPEHLAVCVAALEANADVDWVYSASEIVDLDSGGMLDPHCFYQGGRPRPFMRLRHDTRGALHVITDDGAIQCQIEHGLYCGLQNSVLRRRVFDVLRLESASRNEAEDQLFAIRALAAGFRLAYVDAVHVRYHVHHGNSSGSAKSVTLDRHRRVYEPLIAGYARLEREITLTRRERRALRRRLARELFWHLGYAGFWVFGAKAEALATYRRALRAWPWDWRLWKSFVLAAIRTPPPRPDAAQHEEVR